MAATKSEEKVKVELTCPKCRRDLVRINRNVIDKVIGVLIPIKRYKCLGCFWQGIRISSSSN